MAPNVEHRYEDLFLLSEFLVNMTLASQLGSFGAAGLTTDHILTAQSWLANGAHVTIRFRTEEQCNFLRKEEHEEDSKTKRVTEGDALGSITSKLVTTVTEYLWDFQVFFLALRAHFFVKLQTNHAVKPP